jgi:predicted nucleic acid-binding protein
LSGFLLDTNCISEVVSLRPEPRVLEWMDSTDERLLYISVLTLGAIRKGLAELPVRFSRRILPVDAGVADR